MQLLFISSPKWFFSTWKEQYGKKKNLFVMNFFCVYSPPVNTRGSMNAVQGTRI